MYSRQNQEHSIGIEAVRQLGDTENSAWLRCKEEGRDW